MPDHAFASFWCREFSEGTMLGQFRRLLETVPFSTQGSGFTSLVIRAVEPSETPLVERDFRLAPLTAADLVHLATEHLNADCSFETQACWDLWSYQAGRWQRLPQRVELVCNGEVYDHGTFAEMGHFQIDAGLENLFTGRVAGSREPPGSREAGEKIRENIRLLRDWLRKIQSALELNHYQLWSEGEDNFEAVLDEIAAP